jgi:hypothetical protein
LKIETFSMATPHEFFMRVMAGALSKAAEDGAVPLSEVNDWLSEQSSLQASGDFFQMWLFAVVRGTV